MSNWVLVIYSELIYLDAFKSPRCFNQISSIPGFLTKKECQQAGNEICAGSKNILFRCIEQKK